MNARVVWLGWLWVLLLFIGMVAPQEWNMANGTIVRLELAPRDPRSLMQGDYMSLNYQVARNIPRTRDFVDDGFLIVRVDERGVGSFARIQTDLNPRSAIEAALFFRVRKGEVHFATNAFFFQEGHAERFATAKYGEFRVDSRGNPLLIRMLDDKMQTLGDMRR